MYVVDFEYDGIRLSDKGYMICYFNGSEDQISNGSEITFAEVPLQHGVRRAVAGTSYESVITTSFSICKNICSTSYMDGIISVAEMRDLARWLGRKEYLPFKLLCDGYDEITYFGTFNIDQIKIGTDIIGLQLTLTTNSPFGWLDEVTETFSNTRTFSLEDQSDEVGYLYLKMDLTCRTAGELRITNSMDVANPSIIANCASGEEITIYHPLISTSDPSHVIAQDFNYEYPKIMNTFAQRKNTYTLSMNCNVTVSYRPLAKIGV